MPDPKLVVGGAVLLCCSVSVAVAMMGGRDETSTTESPDPPSQSAPTSTTGSPGSSTQSASRPIKWVKSSTVNCGSVSTSGYVVGFKTPQHSWEDFLFECDNEQKTNRDNDEAFQTNRLQNMDCGSGRIIRSIRREPGVYNFTCYTPIPSAEIASVASRQITRPIPEDKVIRCETGEHLQGTYGTHFVCIKKSSDPSTQLSEFENEAAKYGAVPGILDKPKTLVTSSSDSESAERCKAAARHNEALMWHYDTKNQKCYHYGKDKNYKYEGSPTDETNMTGCAFDGRPNTATGCNSYPETRIFKQKISGWDIGGAPLKITGRTEMPNLPDDWNDRIGSVTVPKYTKLILYKDANYGGEKREHTGSKSADLMGSSSSVSSLKTEYI